MDKINNRFLNKLDVGVYEYYVRDLPLHGSYVEVFKSDYNKEVGILFNFNTFNHEEAQGVLYIINEIYDVIKDAFYRENRDALPSYMEYGPALLHTTDERSFRLKFMSDVITDYKKYPKDKVAGVLASTPDSTFEKFTENMIKFFKFAKDFKVTEEQTERIVNKIIDLTEKYNDEIDNYNIMSYEVNRYHLSEYKSIADWKKVTQNDINAVIYNLFSVFSLKNIEILCPKSVSINDIDEFIDTLLEDSLNTYLDAKSKIGVKMTHHPSLYLADYKNIKLLDKELYYNTKITDEYKEWRKNKISVFKTNRYSQSVIMTTPLVSSSKSFIVGTDGGDEICGYLSGRILSNMFVSFLKAKSALASDLYSIKEQVLFKEIKDDKIYTSFSLICDDVYKRVDLKNIINEFDTYVIENLDSYLKQYVYNLMRSIRKFIIGTTYRQSTRHIFESNMYLNIPGMCDRTTASGRLEIVSRYLGNNDDLLFPEYSQFLTSDTFMSYLKQAVMHNKDELRFMIFTQEK